MLKKIFIFVFFTLLLVPVLHINRDKISKTENRTLAPAARFLGSNNWVNKTFGRDFDNWFTDRFFGRYYLMQLNNFIFTQGGMDIFLWGIWHGIFIIFEKISGWHKLNKNILISGIQHIYTILIFVIGWVMFRADTVEYGLQYIKRMFSFNTNITPFYDIYYFVKPIGILLFVLAILCATPYIKQLFDKFKGTFGEYVYLISLFVFTVSVLAASSYNPFIYFRF